MTREIAKKNVVQWMEKYKAAWEQNDLSIAIRLFSHDAEYWETPFGPVLKGIDSIVNYWQDETRVWKDIRFSYEDVAILPLRSFYARWHCNLTRQSTKTPMQMAGTFYCEMNEDGLVDKLIEYWHQRNFPDGVTK